MTFFVTEQQYEILKAGGINLKDYEIIKRIPIKMKECILWHSYKPIKAFAHQYRQDTNDMSLVAIGYVCRRCHKRKITRHGYPYPDALNEAYLWREEGDA